MIFLDFEASAIMNGYPIEVGFCKVDADRSMQSVARLIRHDEWLNELQRWDWRAEEIHRIDRAALIEFGLPPFAVMLWLNEQLAGQVAIADSPFDGLWLLELALAAGIEPTFGLVDDISVAFTGPEIGQKATAAQAEEACSKTHRADSDSENLATRYVMSLAQGSPVHRLFRKGEGYVRRSLVR